MVSSNFSLIFGLTGIKRVQDGGANQSSNGPWSGLWQGLQISAHLKEWIIGYRRNEKNGYEIEASMNLGAGYDIISVQKRRGSGATESDAMANTMGCFSQLCIFLGIGNVYVWGFSLCVSLRAWIWLFCFFFRLNTFLPGGLTPLPFFFNVIYFVSFSFCKRRK